MVYVGIVAEVLGINLEVVKGALLSQFHNNTSVAESNFEIVLLAGEWAKHNLEKRDRYYVEPMQPLDDYIMTNGNLAGALGAIYGGFQFCGWYPITPASSMVEALMAMRPASGKDPETKKNNFAIVQAEDELAAIGMVVGAGWAGVRAMTSTSGRALV